MSAKTKNEVAASEKPKPKFFSHHATYYVAADASPEDLLNDAGCLRESAKGTLFEIAEHMNNGAFYAAMYLVEMGYNALSEAQVRMSREAGA
jgi:hypothetical protein